MFQQSDIDDNDHADDVDDSDDNNKSGDGGEKEDNQKRKAICKQTSLPPNFTFNVRPPSPHCTDDENSGM